MADYVRDPNDWPLLLVGPMVRRVSEDSASVFVATSEPCLVRLDVFDGTDPAAGDNFSRTALASSAAIPTVAIGARLHVALVQASGLSLSAGVLYGYGLGITPDGGSEQTLGDLGLLSGDHALGYDADYLPGFVLPQGLDRLKLIHASCRKAHGGGPDVLPTVDALVAEHRDDGDQRPQQLFLTGDQIYADDVAPGLLVALTEAGELLLGWPTPETLPDTDGSPTLLPVDLTAPGRRSELLEALGVKPRTHYADNHLLYLGEWLAAYAMAWSDAIWMRSDGTTGRTYELPQPSLLPWPYPHDTSTIEALAYAERLPHVRRALANVATYMMFDDHEITDDWHLNKAVSDRLRSAPLGRRLMRNGLLGYAVFQDWGNQPLGYEPGTHGETILDALKMASDGGGGFEDPVIAATPDALDVVLDLGTTPASASAHADRKRWDYSVTCPEHRVVSLDIRTWRGFPSGVLAEKYNAALISEEAQAFQIDPLLADLQDRLLLLVSPAPVIGLFLVEVLQKLKITAEPVHGTEVVDNEPWAGHRESFEALLRRLTPYSPVVFLSGDVHYAFSQVSAWCDADGSLARFIQLTASSTKNADNLTNALSVLELITGPLKENFWITSEEAAQFLDEQGPDLHDRALEMLEGWWNDALSGDADVLLMLTRGWRDFWRLHWVPGVGVLKQLPDLQYAGPVTYDQLRQLMDLLELDPNATATIKTLTLEDEREPEERDDHSVALQDELNALPTHERMGILRRHAGSIGVCNVGVVTFDNDGADDWLQHELYWRHVREPVDPFEGAMTTRHRVRLRDPVDREDTTP